MFRLKADLSRKNGRHINFNKNKLSIFRLFFVKNFKKNYSTAGFTLVETVLYLVIVGVILTSIVDFSITLGNSSSKLSANIDAARNRRTALQAINYLVRNADGLWKDINGDCSNFSATPPVLALYFNDDTYLPGTCVAGGGGVKITIAENRLKMTCYPGAAYNGSYGSCSTSAGNSYFLTGPEVIVSNSNFSLATSTASSTTNGFTSVSAHLNVRVGSTDQLSIKASSQATSTAVLRNEQPNGLISWWKFDDADTATAVDSISGYNLTCTGAPASVAGLVSDSGNAFHFNTSESDVCSVDNPEKLNLGNSFTISVWLKTDGPDDSEHAIIDKYANSASGYYLYNQESAGEMVFYICNGTTCTSILDAPAVIDDATVYNVTVVYDQPSDIAKMLIYKKGVGGVSTTTASSLLLLVNSSAANYPRIGSNFEGSLDEFRIYNRALSDAEVWALQTQGRN